MRVACPVGGMLHGCSWKGAMSSISAQNAGRAPAHKPEDNRLPHSSAIRQLGSEFLRLAVFPLYHRKTLPGVYHFLKEYKSWEFASKENLAKLQWDRVRKILTHASRNVPFYRQQFDAWGIDAGSISTPEEFARLPILTKSVLQLRFNELLNEQSDLNRRLKNASGGSTGQPVQFYQDQHYWEYSRAAQWAIEGWWGIRPGDRTASIWGCDRDLPEQTRGERLYGKITQLRVCNAFALGETQMKSFAEMMVKWKPRFVVGYASALELFSRFLLSEPRYRVQPIAVKSSAEVLTDSQRQLIEKAFQAPVYNFYGSRETNVLGEECSAHQGLHVNSLGRYIEVVGDDGRLLPPGVPGRILVTDVTNYTMPFLRYQLEDIGSWAEGVCPCGRSFPRLAKLYGRSSDFIVTPEGKIIHGEYFTHLFYGLSQIQTFQMVQEARDSVRLDYVLQAGASEFPLEELRRRTQEMLGSAVRCELRRVDQIQRPASGKHRFTVSKVAPPWGMNSRMEGDSATNPAGQSAG